jgi:hypothetical protein
MWYSAFAVSLYWKRTASTCDQYLTVVYYNYDVMASRRTLQMMYAQQQQQQQHQQQQSYAYPPGAAAGNQHLIATHMANMGAPVQQLQQFNQAQQQQFQLMHQQHQQQLQQQQQQQQAFGSSSLDTSAEAANYWGRKYPGVTYTNGKVSATLCCSIYKCICDDYTFYCMLLGVVVMLRDNSICDCRVH